MVINWLTKLVVVLAILGVLGFDGIAVGVGHFDASDDATSAAQAAATSWRQGHDYATAEKAAVDSLSSSDVFVPKSLVIAPDGTARIQVVRKVTTLVFQVIPGVKNWTKQTVTASSGPALL